MTGPTALSNWFLAESRVNPHQDVGTFMLMLHLKHLSLATSTFKKSQGLEPMEWSEPAQSSTELSSTGSSHRQCRNRCWWQCSESCQIQKLLQGISCMEQGHGCRDTCTPGTFNNMWEG